MKRFSSFSILFGRCFQPISLAVLLTCLFAATAFGQTTTGSISGTVTDPTGAVVAGATITVTNPATGAVRSVESNDQGAFDVPALQPGKYTITVDAKGFKKAVSRDIIVTVTQTASVTIPLEIGSASETVTVSASQEVINTSSPSVTNVINTRQVVDLPLGGRNPVELAGLQAGIAVVGTDVRGASVSGLRQTAVNLTQDGINAMDNFVKTSSFFALTAPSLNSTSEFSITTSTGGADSGRGVAQVNLVTKGGTNDYHGGAFLQIINNWTDANTWFNQSIKAAKPILRQHYDGFDIGGPMYFPRFGEGGPSVSSGKDRAFFFFSYEKFVQSDARSRNRTVLTPSARTGSYTYTPICGTGAAGIAACAPGVVSGVPRTINLLAQTGVPFNAVNPFMTAHLDQIPNPNNSTCADSDNFNISCFQFNASQLTTNDKYVFRYDHQIFKDRDLGSHKVEFVFSRALTRTEPDVTTNSIDAPFPGGVNGLQYSTRNLFTPALVSTFGPNVTNVLRYGRQWAPVVFDRDVPAAAPFVILPGVLTGYDNNFVPQPRNTIVHQITDNLSWVKGNHTYKFGMDWQNVLGLSLNDAGIIQENRLGVSTANPSNLTIASHLLNASNAQLTAANTVYGAITGLLNNSVLTLNVSSPTSGFVPGYTRDRQVQGKDLALFAQDQWRMRSNFTLSYGVRWDYMGVPTVPNGLAIQPTNFDSIWGVSGVNNLFNPNAAPGSQTAAGATLNFVSGDTGIGLYKNDWNNFAPFGGFAYSPAFKSGFLHTLFGDEGTSSFRGGYAMSFLHDGVTTFTNLLGTGNTNPGLIQNATSSVLSGVTPANNQLRGQLTAGGVPLILPTFQIPITDRQNFLTTNGGGGLWTANPNLKAAYVHQWNFGIEREIFKNTALEIRYVGNYAPNTWRAYDINEVNVFENGFLQDFVRAQGNLAACTAAGTVACRAAQTAGGVPTAQLSNSSFNNWGLPGQVPLTIFSRLFNAAGLPATTSTALEYASAAFITNLNNNNVGGFASTLAFNPTYRTNRENPALGLAGNFFVANPNAAFVRVLANDAMSNYNAMEIELRKRFSNGLQFQADYTWSKAMGNAVDVQGNNQSDLAPRLTLRNPDADYRRSGQDQTQRFVANGLYDLPFGKGRKYLSGAHGVVDALLGGFSMGAIVTWATGVPWFVASGRTTFNNGNSATAFNGNGAQLTGITFEEFKKNVGLYKTPTGVFFVNPNLLDLTLGTTGATTGQVTTSKLKAGLMAAPAPGTFGNFPVNSLSGPSYFNFDLSVIKKFRITETAYFQLKGTAINILNHPNFIYGNTNFDSTSFGRITAQRGVTRQMNIIAEFRF